MSFVVSHGHIFTPNLFNTLKVAWNRLVTDRGSPLDRNLNPEIGLKGANTELAGFALFNINGYAGLGPPANNPQFSDSQTRQLTEDLQWTRGRHTLKAGGNFMFIQSPHRQAFQSNGTFTFNGNFTRQSSNNTFGNSWGDFLLGIPFNSQLSNVAQGNQRRRIHAGYVQDDFKATARLTLNLGLRYEYIGPWFEKYNRYSNFDVDSLRANPNQAPKLLLATSGGIEQRSTLRPDYKNFGPRVGLAYRLGDRTVVRSGYGMYFGGVDHIGDRYLHASAPFFFQSGSTRIPSTRSSCCATASRRAPPPPPSATCKPSRRTAPTAPLTRSSGTSPSSAKWPPAWRWKSVTPAPGQPPAAAL